MNIQEIYLRDISAYPQLTPQEKLTLAHRARQGDAEARERLIQTHLILVVNIARRHLRPEVEFLDLIQEGNIGLIKAIDMFDPTQGNQISTLAFYWINKHIQRFLNHEPEDTLSLDMELTDSSEYLLLGDTIEDKDTIFGEQTIQHIDAVMEHEEMQRQVREMLSRLPEREQEVLRLLYGLDDYPELSRKEVAKVIGVSAEQVSRIKIKAMQTLHNMLRTYAQQ